MEKAHRGGNLTLERTAQRGATRRIVLTTFGSLGDLHPMIALGIGLKERGHEVVIATSDYYRPNVEAESLNFRALRPAVAPLMQDRDLYRKIMDAKTGSEYLLREIVLPNLRDTYDDLCDAVQGADLLLTHPLALVGPVVAAKTGVAWASYVLSPLSMFSAYDFPVLPQMPTLTKAAHYLPPLAVLMRKIGKARTDAWAQPLYALRKELGLPNGENPFFEGQYSPDLNLAFWWEGFAPPKPDWAANTRVVGFPYYDRQRGEAEMPEGLEEFLQSGPPPVVFTLGSAAVMDAGDFYELSITGSKRMHKRAVLLTGPEGRNQLPHPLPKHVAAFPYAPFSKLFPRAAAIVHSGGIGTTAQALRSGRPQLIVPFSHDQFDNGARVQRLGAGRVVPRKTYRTLHIGAELARILNDQPYIQKAQQIAGRMQDSDGIPAACDAIEARLAALR